MGEARLNSLALMGTHKSRLTKVSTEKIIQKFKEKPRTAKLHTKIVSSEYISSSDSDECDGVDDKGSFYLLFIFVKTFYMNQNVIMLTFFSEVFFKIRVSDPLYFLRLRLHMDSKTVNYNFISLKSNNDLKYKKLTILILISFFYHITRAVPYIWIQPDFDGKLDIRNSESGLPKSGRIWIRILVYFHRKLTAFVGF